jgi:hypothetical protein
MSSSVEVFIGNPFDELGWIVYFFLIEWRNHCWSGAWNIRRHSSPYQNSDFDMSQQVLSEIQIGCSSLPRVCFVVLIVIYQVCIYDQR